jgi:HAD domain in Swiss Army Knife RNA repair proteins
MNYRVLFVDFDGVLTSVGSIIYNNRLKLLGLTDTPTHESFDPIACSNLQYILEELPDVQVVVSSTWRKHKTLHALQEVFKVNNLLPERMIGTTPISEEGYRGKEIEAYLKEHPEVTEFAIIDDDSDMKPYMDRLVKTDSRNGLTFTDAEKVIEMFGGLNEKE